MTSAESAFPNAVVRIPLDQDGWNGLPRSREALMQLAAFSLCRAQRRRSRKRRSLVKKSVRSRRVSVSGSGKALCLVPADEP